MVSQKRLKELFNYDPATGWFTYRLPTKGRKRGSRAGGTDPLGYRNISVDGVKCREHKLAWLYMYGEWVEGLLDHKNRVPSDNCIDNLRKATPSQNSANCRHFGPSGCRGVMWRPDRNKWRTRIRYQNKRWTLGHFDTKEEAFAVYIAKAKEIYGEFCPFD